MPTLVPRFVVEQFQSGVRGGTLTAAALTCDVSGFMALTEELMGEEGIATAQTTGLAATGAGPSLPVRQPSEGRVPMQPT